MKKIIMITITALLLSCGHYDKTVAAYTGYAKICVDNVSYIQFTSGASVQYDVNGHVMGCKD